jgi:hypothetical protein
MTDKDDPPPSHLAQAERELGDLIRRHGIGSALIVVSAMTRFNGPSLIAADLATTLRAMGVQVTLAGWLTHAPYLEEVPGLGGAIALSRDPRPLVGRGFDLVIAHGWRSAGFALLECAVRFRHLVLCSFSSSVDGEAIFGLEGKADALLFAADRARDMQEASLAHCPAPRVIYRNAVPRTWHLGAANPGALAHVGVVTNHLCPEVRELIARLQAAGITTSLVGREGTARLLDPATMDGFDAVVTIGHTVQKALARGVPVFCYDHFGGPGWITSANLDHAEANLFAGLDASRRPAEALLREMVDGHAQAISEAPALRDVARRRYLVEERLAAVLGAFTPRAAMRDFGGPEHWNARRILHYALAPKSGRSIFPRGYMLAPASPAPLRVIEAATPPAAAPVLDAQASVTPLTFLGAQGAIIEGKLRVRLVGQHPAPRLFARDEAGEERDLPFEHSEAVARSHATYPITILSANLAIPLGEATRRLEIRVAPDVTAAAAWSMVAELRISD